MKNKKIVQLVIENIKYYLNIYNYDEEIKLEGLNYILNYLKNNDYNSVENNMVDLGGGNGLFSYRLKKRGFKPKITVVDNYVNQEFGFKHISCDIENLENHKNYNIVLCLLVLELVQDRTKVIKKINDIMNDKGICFISVPNIDGINIKMWREKAKNSSSKLSKIFLENQKLVTIDKIEEELLLFNMEITDIYSFGFLPVYATSNKKRFTKQCYLDLNNKLKKYLKPSYNLLVVKKIKNQ